MIGDLAVLLAGGGECLAYLRAVRDQAPLFGPLYDSNYRLESVETGKVAAQQVGG